MEEMNLSGCFLVFAFGLLVGISIGLTNSVLGLKICAVIAGIKNYKSIIKKKERKQSHSVISKN